MVAFQCCVIQACEFNEADGGGWVKDDKVGFKRS
jgi:hypothetical protein